MKLRSIVLGLALGSFSLLAVAQQPIVIKFSHVVAADTPKGHAAEYFKKKAEELTKGRVKVEVYANSTLYKDKEEMEALQIGAVQMLAPSLAKFGPLGVKEFEVFDLPYIFDNYDDLHKVTQGPVGRMLLNKLEPKGVKGLAYWDNGFKSFSANKPIRTPEDLKGMKMHEVQKHLTLTEHGYLGYAVITNKKFWDGLPADIRTQLESAMEQATRYANQIAKQENDQALEAVKKSGRTQVYVPTAAERSAFKKATIKVHTEMESRIGKDLIQSIYKETGFNPAKL